MTCSGKARDEARIDRVRRRASADYPARIVRIGAQLVDQRLAASYRVIALDLYNHGGSPWAETMTYAEMAEDVAGFIAAVGLDRPGIFGHSMGGKVAMTLALGRDVALGALVVVDIAPVSYDGGFGDYVEAMSAVDLDSVERRADADAALAGTVADPALRAFLLQNLIARDGSYAWRINLAAIGAGLSGFSLAEPASTFAGPPCSSRAGGRATSPRNTMALSTSTSRAPRSPSSTVPVIGPTPSSRRTSSPSSSPSLTSIRADPARARRWLARGSGRPARISVGRFPRSIDRPDQSNRRLAFRDGRIDRLRPRHRMLRIRFDHARGVHDRPATPPVCKYSPFSTLEQPRSDYRLATRN
jgi:pimeloyl-ACP methyl ester carboxylesterase